MTCTFEVHYREAGEACVQHAHSVIKSVSINAHVWEDWQHTLRCVSGIQRVELYCISKDGVPVGCAALAYDNDFNLGDCITVAACASAGRTPFMRFVLTYAKSLARELGAKYVAYTKAINRLRYELRYMEV